MSSKRTDTSVAGVFTDLSDLLEEGTTSPMRKISIPPPPAEKELHQFVPTSLMVDTHPNEFQPVSVTPERLPSLIQQGPDESEEIAELLKAPSSKTMRFSSEANPAAAFAPSTGAPPVLAPTTPVEARRAAQRTDPMGDAVSAVRASLPSVPDSSAYLRPSLPAPAPAAVPPRTFSLSALVVSIVVAALVASVVTALAGARLVKACRQTPSDHACLLAP